jgi:hypothetical protein
MVETFMQGRTSILAQLEPTKALVALASTFEIATIDLRIDVRVEEIEATNMEE